MNQTQSQPFSTIHSDPVIAALLKDLGAHLVPYTFDDGRVGAEVRCDDDSHISHIFQRWFMPEYEGIPTLLFLETSSNTGDWRISLVSNLKASFTGEGNLIYTTNPADGQYVFVRYADHPRVLLVEAGPKFTVDERHVVKLLVREQDVHELVTAPDGQETVSQHGLGVEAFAQQAMDSLPSAEDTDPVIPDDLPSTDDLGSDEPTADADNAVVGASDSEPDSPQV